MCQGGLFEQEKVELSTGNSWSGYPNLRSVYKQQQMGIDVLSLRIELLGVHLLIQGTRDMSLVHIWVSSFPHQKLRISCPRSINQVSVMESYPRNDSKRCIDFPENNEVPAWKLTIFSFLLSILGRLRKQENTSLIASQKTCFLNEKQKHLSVLSSSRKKRRIHLSHFPCLGRMFSFKENMRDCHRFQKNWESDEEGGEYLKSAFRLEVPTTRWLTELTVT